MSEAFEGLRARLCRVIGFDVGGGIAESTSARPVGGSAGRDDWLDSECDAFRGPVLSALGERANGFIRGRPKEAAIME